MGMSVAHFPPEIAQTLTPIRLLAQAGAAFAILPAPSLLDPDHRVTRVVDIELLSPDRLVRYLGRQLSTRTLKSLADAFMQAAQDPFPEQSVATVQDDLAGLTVLFIESTPFEVTLEFLVSTDLENDLPEHDHLAFDMARAGLIDAAHAIAAWLA
jgi:hypothetical protein